MRFFIPLIIVVVMVAAGCTAVQQEIRAQQEPRAKVTTSSEPLDDTKCDLAFYAPGDSIYQADSPEFMMREMAPFIIAELGILQHHMATGQWAESWDEVLAYVPILPLFPGSNKPYSFADIGDFEGEYPADTVIASWDPEGPTVYFAIGGKAGFKCLSLNPDLLQKHLEMMYKIAENENEKGIDPETNSHRLMENLKQTTEFMIRVFELRHERMPATRDELFEGFAINPKFKPGYSVEPGSEIGTFNLRIDPVGNRSYFTGITEPSGKLLKQSGFFRKPFEELDREVFGATLDTDGYVTLLTEADFIN